MSSSRTVPPLTQIHLYRDFYVVPAREMRLNISTSHLTMAVHVHVTYGRGSLSRHYMCTRTETERERPPASRGSRSERELRDFPRPREREMFYCLTTRRCATARCAMTVYGATAEAEHGYATAATGLPAGGVVRISLSLFKAAFLADCCGSVCRVTGSHLFGEFQLINRSMFQ